MSSPADVQIVFCTAPDPETGQRIADHLVEYRLAACVNMLPGVKSVYRWKGELCTDSEILLMIKSGTADYASLEAAIRELHPYELPEIIAVPLSNGLPKYLEWVCNIKNEAE
ncbi:MAG TPA: divalent-cation tolerance protein CutA [Gammaproteobacteria bacterium]|nr:divalent-cation tolerance protein CutA [Gammaproteobacteria bacterium]